MRGVTWKFTFVYETSEMELSGNYVLGGHILTYIGSFPAIYSLALPNGKMVNFPPDMTMAPYKFSPCMEHYKVSDRAACLEALFAGNEDVVFVLVIGA